MPHKDPEARRAYARQWAQDHADHRREQQRRWKQANPKMVRAQVRRWREAHPELTRLLYTAGQVVRAAINNGTLVRPDSCEECHKPCKPQAAHFNYTELLRVRWLCAACHVKWDDEHPKTKGDPDAK